MTLACARNEVRNNTLLTGFKKYTKTAKLDLFT